MENKMKNTSKTFKFSPRVFAQKCFYLMGEKPDEKNFTKIVFKEGDCEEETTMQKVARPQTPQSLSSEIEGQLRVLDRHYQKLISYDSNYSDDLTEMRSELLVLRVFENAERGPYETLLDAGFCIELAKTLRLIGLILRNIRVLQHTYNNQRVDTQLLIMQLTLLAHFSELQEMRRECLRREDYDR
ncbi:MAG: hypothetical protein E7375_00030 [Clostridiales bacterium]|nr:hypothetical protein [Clostridiales bacterium]